MTPSVFLRKVLWLMLRTKGDFFSEKCPEVKANPYGVRRTSYFVCCGLPATGVLASSGACTRR